MAEIIDTTLANIEKIGCGCLQNPKHLGFQIKRGWLTKRFQEGLKIKALYIDGKKKGFIEIVPAEYAWQPIIAPGYLFIQCLWIKAKIDRDQGYAGLMIKNAIKYAQDQKFQGVVVTSSEGSWIAGRSVFVKQGFKVVDKRGAFELLSFSFNSSIKPQFRIKEPELDKFEGLHIIYGDQCPFVSKMIPEYEQLAKKRKLNLTITKITNPQEMQSFPSLYGVFCLIFNGKIYADHYISKTRFENILNKEIKIG